MFYYDKKQTTFNETANNITVISIRNYCSFSKPSEQMILAFIDLINRILLPFGLMITCSFILIHSIYTLRKRILENFLPKQHKKYQKNIKLAITSISFNMFYIILNLPISVNYLFINSDDFMIILCLNIFYSSFSINFYLVLISNSLFRSEFLALFGKKSLIKETGEKFVF